MMKKRVFKWNKSCGLALLPILVAAPLFSAFSSIAKDPGDEPQKPDHIICEPYPECVIYGVEQNR